MKLQIQIKKEPNKPSTLSCTREDGSITYAKLQLDFEIHDIAHFVVERRLQLKNAFYGLLSRGYQINDFMLPKLERPDALQPQNLLPEALATEHLINLLTIDFMHPDHEMDVFNTLEDILKEHHLAFPKKIQKEEIILIQNELSAWMSKWNELPHGKVLEMIFELP